MFNFCSTEAKCRVMLWIVLVKTFFRDKLKQMYVQIVTCNNEILDENKEISSNSNPTGTRVLEGCEGPSSLGDGGGAESAATRSPPPR